MTNEEYMRLAMGEAEIAVQEGNGPFAVVVVDANGEVVWKDHDRINELTNPTAHGEMNAIRNLCSTMKSLSLQGLTFYVTSEPCPMCLAAMVKAHVSRVYYGAKTETTASLPIPVEVMASYAKKYPIEVTGGILADECLAQREAVYTS